MENIKKIVQPLFLIVLILVLLIILKDFLIPLAYGFLLAVIVYPVCNNLEKMKWPKTLAISFSLLLILMIIGFVVFVGVIQLQIINKELPSLMWRIEQFFPAIQKWLKRSFGLSVMQQNMFVNAVEKDILSLVASALPGFFSFMVNMLLNFVIIPLYTVLILYYRKMLVEFTGSLIMRKHNDDFLKIVSETIHMYFNYIKGMAGVYLTVGILNSIGLLILGVNYAVVFGMVTALMTIIPYVGIIISSLLPIAMIWAETNNILYPLGVIAVFSIVQYLEANLIFPYIVGKQIGINMFISIIAIILGGVIWGLSGMVLFLPFIAIAKIVFSHYEGLKAINKLLEVQ